MVKSATHKAGISGKHPAISALLPVYNTNPLHLRAAIDSILNQTFKDFELIILNDASTDASVESTALSYDDPRIRYFKNSRNLGISNSRNKLMTLSRGKYLAVVDHDDINLPLRFEKQVDFMEKHDDVVLLGAAYKRFGNLFKRGAIYDPTNDANIRTMLFFKCVIHHPTAMMRADVIKKHGIIYESSYISVNDVQIFADLSQAGKIANLPQVLLLYREHRTMTSKTRRDKIVAEQKSLRREFCSRMQARLSPQEFGVLNDNILKGDVIKDAETLKLMDAVFGKLVAANRKSRYLPQKEFEKACAAYLIKRCYKAAVLQHVSSKELLQSTKLPVYQAKKPVLLTIFNLFLKEQMS